ncbi:tonB-system energizer ExbB [Roseinatronobacter sp. S2]|uniref:tonB-system energizer ExbB n=1 Tax=Roseinatronobacter sp. S2 TaxID=3035471 RepID=UPI00240FB7E9|nr:tonB-system energizer ExbB [Roseinatronobacter sp. S2]WFE76954.1 tonB-system energizer ExbB [Roseinatronobacter sp. S2]
MSYRLSLSFSVAAALCALSLILTCPALAQEGGTPNAPPAGQDEPRAVAPSASATTDGVSQDDPALVPFPLESTTPDPAHAGIPAPEQMVTQDPFPAPLSDPVGAVRWLLTQTESEAHDLSPIGMYRGSDIVVKLVMLGLVFASLVTWTVWLAKTLELWGMRARARSALKVLARSTTLNEAQNRLKAGRGIVGHMLAETVQEVEQSLPALNHAGGAGLKERVAAALSRSEAQSARRMARGTGVLATIGSTAPFVGLFGTVWGIMNSFISIAESNTTNLAVVAPGIAEALLATALGLVAAIPAVVVYNMFARSIAGYRLLIGDAGERIARLVSRDLDRRAVPEPVVAQAGG